MRSIRYVSVLLLALSAFLPSARLVGASKGLREYLVYFGTYTGKGSKGIYVCRFRPATGKLTPVELAAETVSPSFLAVDPAQRFLFAANEIGDYQNAKSGSVSSFAIDRRSGKLSALNTVASRGADPCHLTVDKAGKHVLVANYTGGSVAVLPIKPDGALGESSDFVQHLGSSVDPERQKEPHAHDVVLTPDNRFAVVADLGLDKLLVYRYDLENGKLASNDPPFGRVKPGSGPRHFALHPNGRWAYVISEIGNTITAFDWDGDKGSLHIQPAFNYDGVHVVGRANEKEVDLLGTGKGPYQFTLEAEHFADCIRHNKRPESPGEEGLRDMLAIEAIYRAAGTPIA